MSSAIFHVKVTTAAAVAVVVEAVGLAVALIPALAPEKQVLITAGTTVVVAVSLVVNAIHAIAGTHASPDLLPLLGEPITGRVGSTDPAPPVIVNVHPAPSSHPEARPAGLVPVPVPPVTAA